MLTQSGHLVLADISGYTAFVAETELEHSREILNELLETLVRCLGTRLRIEQIEGDAIFALGPDLPDDPGAWLEDCFVRFHRHLNAIKRVSTCPLPGLLERRDPHAEVRLPLRRVPAAELPRQGDVRGQRSEPGPPSPEEHGALSRIRARHD